MKKMMKLVCLTLFIVGSVIVWQKFHMDYKVRETAVYMLLEKDSLTADEKKWVDDITGGYDDSFISLDEEHRKLFKKHFGHER